MNNQPTLATKWKGRVLVCIEHEDVERPQASCVQTPKEIIEGATELLKPKAYTIMAEVGSCIVTPEDCGEYSMQFRIANEEINIEKKPLVGFNYNRWNYRLDKEREVFFPYNSVEEIGDIFVYLMKGDNIVSYKRVPAKNFTEKDPIISWHEMEPEPVGGHVTSPKKAGLVSFKLSIGRGKKEDFNFLKEKHWSKKPARRP